MLIVKMIPSTRRGLVCNGQWPVKKPGKGTPIPGMPAGSPTRVGMGKKIGSLRTKMLKYLMLYPKALKPTHLISYL